MSALEAAPKWPDMEYETRCRLVWQCNHDNLTVKQMAFVLGCEQGGHILAFARSEGITVGGRNVSPSWPAKDDPGWIGTSLDTVRMHHWQYQHDGARRTREENEAKDRMRAIPHFHPLFPTNNTGVISGDDTCLFHGAGASEAA